jgi:hypothetical protein
LSQRWKDKDSDFDDNHEYYPPTLLANYRSGQICPLQSTNKKKRATDKVGERIGMSRRSYENAKPIVEKCEFLREHGLEIEALALE